MYQNTNSKWGHDNWVPTVNTMISLGNEVVNGLIKGRGSNPLMGTRASDLVLLSKNIYAKHVEYKNGFAAGVVSKADWSKRLNVHKTLVDEGYYQDPVGDTAKQILNDWNEMNKPVTVEQAVTQPIKKAAAGHPVNNLGLKDAIAKAVTQSIAAITADVKPSLDSINKIADEIRNKRRKS